MSGDRSRGLDASIRVGAKPKKEQPPWETHNQEIYFSTLVATHMLCTCSSLSEYRSGAGETLVLGLTGEGLNRFREESEDLGYRQVPGHSRSFVDRITDLAVEVRMTGHHPGIRSPGPIQFPNPADTREEWGQMQVVPLAPLIELKLAAHWYYDLGDVVSLIRARELDESFVEQLHPAVRVDYLKCLDEKRRDDEFDALE